MSSIQIDRAMQVHLEDPRVINWIQNAKLTTQLCALKISTGDGDCLLDAVSVALCGTEQRTPDLERYIGMALMNRGFLNRLLERLMLMSGNPEIVEASFVHVPLTVWKDTLQSNNGADPLARLTDDRQLFLLTNMLHRPIIVLCEENAEVSSCGAEDLTGVYLPLLRDPDECIKTPILLAYCDHFVPLVPRVGHQTSPDAISYIPLVTAAFVHLPIQFLKTEEEPRALEILQRYLIVEEVPHATGNDSTIPVLVAKVNCEEFAPIWQNTEAFSDNQNCSPKIIDSRPSSQGSDIDDIPRSLGTQTDTLFCRFCHNEIAETTSAGTDSQRGICDNHHSNPSQEEGNTSESQQEHSCCDGFNDDSDDDDSCFYPNCDKPAEWWPYCYRHSPDSGYAPGALLDCHEKFLKDKRDSQLELQATDPHDQSTIDGSGQASQTSVTDHNSSPAIVECAQAEPTSDSNYSSSNDDSDDDDSCVYPHCDEPAEWWPYCYRHSPDSGYAPGALLDCHEKYREEKGLSTTCNEDQRNCTDISDVVESRTERQTCDTSYNIDDSLDQSDDEDDCVYPGCSRPSDIWPFCYEHSPDSGLSPGALLDCSKKYQRLSGTEQTVQQYPETLDLNGKPPP